MPLAINRHQHGRTAHMRQHQEFTIKQRHYSRDELNLIRLPSINPALFVLNFLITVYLWGICNKNNLIGSNTFPHHCVSKMLIFPPIICDCFESYFIYYIHIYISLICKSLFFSTFTQNLKIKLIHVRTHLKDCNIYINVPSSNFIN